MSAYFHHMNAGRYPPSVSLIDATRRYPDIREFGLYATQYAAWLERYPADRFLTLIYEEDIAPDEAKQATLGRVFAHIGVDAGFEPGDVTEERNKRSGDFAIRMKHASPIRRRRDGRGPGADPGLGEVADLDVRAGSGGAGRTVSARGAATRADAGPQPALDPRVAQLTQNSLPSGSWRVVK